MGRSSTDLSRPQLLAMLIELRSCLLDEDMEKREPLFWETQFEQDESDPVCQDKSWRLVSKREKLQYCSSCRENFYNGEGADECWHLTNAKIVRRKFIGINDVPPWTHQPVVETLDCCKRKGYVTVGPDRTC